MSTYYSVIDILKIRENTCISVDDRLLNIKSNSSIKDENNKVYKVLSVGTNCNNSKYTNLLIEGNFNSKKIKLI